MGAPGVVDAPLAGGLSVEQADEIIQATVDRAATLATLTPAGDPADGPGREWSDRVAALPFLG